MGCASSKQKRCRHCRSPYSPVTRSYSMDIHHLPQNRGDSYHVVALTSSTLGSLSQINHPNNKIINVDDDLTEVNGHYNGHFGEKEKKTSREFTVGLIEAKTWSNMIEEKIPKVIPRTPIRTPPGEPETINAWEMMEGLEDVSPLRSPLHLRSFSFDVVRDTNPIPKPADTSVDRPKSRFQEKGSASPKPMWLQMGEGESVISDFDPDVISTFRKSLQELPLDNPFHLRPPDDEKQQPQPQHQHLQPEDGDDLSLDVNNEKKVNDTVGSDYKCGKDKLVLYFTSLRGVRKTYEDCCHVRVIIKGLGVRVDERDVSMHSGFKEELKERLGEGFSRGVLPRVFLGKKYIGGAEEIRRLHEDGQLEKLVECCERLEGGDGGGSLACEACGDIRFVPCKTCSGSCKIYYERDDDDDDDDDDEEEEAEEEEKEAEEEEEEEQVEEEAEGGGKGGGKGRGEGGEEVEYGFQRCPDCNENGLIRCPICCY